MQMMKQDPDTTERYAMKSKSPSTPNLQGARPTFPELSKVIRSLGVFSEIVSIHARVCMRIRGQVCTTQVCIYNTACISSYTNGSIRAPCSYSFVHPGDCSASPQTDPALLSLQLCAGCWCSGTRQNVSSPRSRETSGPSWSPL